MMRLEIAGGIGAGKTTLARVLAQTWRSGLVHEDVLNVPFLRNSVCGCVGSDLLQYKPEGLGAPV